jgi:hypothetical protein
MIDHDGCFHSLHAPTEILVNDGEQVEKGIDQVGSTGQ